ncbi:hypothetical protein GF312_20325 [Candidatus Poribacteria bacterium]|nr:hypothetical protein [Candidatus Poribacteria bacterium]
MRRFYNRPDMIDTAKQFMEILVENTNRDILLKKLNEFYEAVKETYQRSSNKPDEQDVIDSLGKVLYNYMNTLTPEPIPPDII